MVNCFSRANKCHDIDAEIALFVWQRAMRNVRSPFLPVQSINGASDANASSKYGSILKLERSDVMMMVMMVMVG